MKKKGRLEEKCVYEEEGLTWREEFLWRRRVDFKRSFFEEEGLIEREEFLWRRRVGLKRRVFMKKKGWLEEKSFYEEEGLI